MLSGNSPQNTPRNWAEGASLPERPQRELEAPRSPGPGLLGSLFSFLDSAARDEKKRQGYLEMFSANYLKAQEETERIQKDLAALQPQLELTAKTVQILRGRLVKSLELVCHEQKLLELGREADSLKSRYARASNSQNVNHILKTKLKEVAPISTATPAVFGATELVKKLFFGIRLQDKTMGALIKNMSTLGTSATVTPMAGSEDLIQELIRQHGDPSYRPSGRNTNSGGNYLELS